MNNDWLDIDVLEDYLDGKLDAKAMHFVEKQALDDPFVAEALEGLRHSPKRKQTLSILQKQLYDRVSEKPIRRKIWRITTQRLSIAATATVAFIAVSILFFMREVNRKNAETAQRKADGIIVNIDTNNALANNKLPLKDSLPKIDATPKSALIDKAIAEAKTNNLAVFKQTTKKKAPELLSINKTNITTEDISIVAPIVASAPTQSSKEAFYDGALSDKNVNANKATNFKALEKAKSANANLGGYFSSPLDSNFKNKDILVKADGYNDAAVSGVIDPNKIATALSGDKSLNEIALITGANGKKKESIAAQKIELKSVEDLNKKTTGAVTKPIPDPTINYNEYLAHNNKLYNAQGPVQIVSLSFKVSKDGRPTDIKVLKSLSKEADGEAIRLVKNGPNWVLPKAGTNEVTLDIKF